MLATSDGRIVWATVVERADQFGAGPRERLPLLVASSLLDNDVEFELGPLFGELILFGLMDLYDAMIDAYDATRGAWA